MDVIVGPCAALDVRDDAVTACVRRPGLRGREEEAREFRTFASCLGRLRDWLAAEAPTRVALDATSVHWLPVWHALAAMEGVELMLVNAHHVRSLPGRQPGVGDACWLAQLLEYELLCGTCVAHCNVARRRDLNRYRGKLVEGRAREAQRVRKVLDGAGVELESVLTDVTSQSARLVLMTPMAAVVPWKDGSTSTMRSCLACTWPTSTT